VSGVILCVTGSSIRRVVACCLVVVATASCRALGGTSPVATPPPGGWPQPAAGNVTSQMCGLLTDADYTALGHHRPAKVSDAVTEEGDSVDCRYESDDELTVALEPTAEFAKYVFASYLRDHRKELSDDRWPSHLSSGVVGAADESWIDDWTNSGMSNDKKAHEIRVRRGGLIVGITLSGTRGKREKDPQTVLVDLVQLVLRRLPHVGARDTGTTHHIQYEVVGSGRATTIDWKDYSGLTDNGESTNVRLPWSADVPMVTSADGSGPADLPYLQAQTSGHTTLTCLIEIDGVPVDARRTHDGSVNCEARLRDVPDQNQPA
jgi:hypothetical protein